MKSKAITLLIGTLFAGMIACQDERRSPPPAPADYPITPVLFNEVALTEAQIPTLNVVDDTFDEHRAEMDAVIRVARERVD